jgi:hypothetical protein
MKRAKNNTLFRLKQCKTAVFKTAIQKMSQTSEKFPTGKQMLQTGAVSLNNGNTAHSANYQDNASGRFRIVGTLEEERSFHKSWTGELIASLNAE